MKSLDSIPFRNCFTSFHLAVSFALTLGGGGEDSANCAYTITREEVKPDETYRYHLSGMDIEVIIEERITPHQYDPVYVQSRYYIL